MKRILALILALALAVVPISADSILAPKGFAGKLWPGALALYGTYKGVTKYLCTTQPYEKIAGGYRLLSAGHCVQLEPEGLVFSVAEEIGGPQSMVTMLKAYDGEGLDFSIFEFKTNKKYPILVLGTEKDLHVGDRIFYMHFAIGLGKQLSEGRVVSRTLIETKACVQTCVGDFIIQGYGSRGTSGAVVISEKTHKVVGLVTGQWDAAIGLGVEPISKFAQFLAGPGQAYPASDEEN